MNKFIILFFFIFPAQCNWSSKNLTVENNSKAYVEVFLSNVGEKKEIFPEQSVTIKCRKFFFLSVSLGFYNPSNGMYKIKPEKNKNILILGMLNERDRYKIKKV